MQWLEAYLFCLKQTLINEITSAILSVPETVQKELTGLIHKCMMIVYREKENGTLTEGIA